MLPDDIKNSLEQDFHFLENILFCQMATQSSNKPQVRTVRLYGIENNLGLVFITRNTSKKWTALKSNQHAAICFLHPKYQIQLIADCRVDLLNKSSAPELSEKYWNRMREDVKKIYHDDYASNTEYKKEQNLNIPKEIPNSFGLIVAVPYAWEYLFVESNYPDSKRYIYTKNPNGYWEKERLTMR